MPLRDKLQNAVVGNDFKRSRDEQSVLHGFVARATKAHRAKPMKTERHDGGKNHESEQAKTEFTEHLHLNIHSFFAISNQPGVLPEKLLFRRGANSVLLFVEGFFH